jgi:hypothetical protein
MTTHSLEDEARLQYSRILYVWEHPGHPHRERFEENRDLVIGLLEGTDPQAYVESLAPKKWSLRTLTREIPAVIWEFWDESKEVAQQYL